MKGDTREVPDLDPQPPDPSRQASSWSRHLTRVNASPSSESGPAFTSTARMAALRGASPCCASREPLDFGAGAALDFPGSSLQQRDLPVQRRDLALQRRDITAVLRRW